jgi:hypothetical protein
MLDFDGSCEADHRKINISRENKIKRSKLKSKINTKNCALTKIPQP